MKIVDCAWHAKRAPLGSVYIGRGMPGMRGSRLGNPFVAGEVSNPIEKYRRRLVRQVIQRGFLERIALEQLRVDSTLACWCVERPASLVRAGHPIPEPLCHGDVVFTVWSTCAEDWARVPVVDFIEDFAGANAAWSAFYERCYGQPMVWGAKAGQFGFGDFTRELLR